MAPEAYPARDGLSSSREAAEIVRSLTIADTPPTVDGMSPAPPPASPARPAVPASPAVPQVTYARIFATFTPLALMWLMMGLEQPLVAAAVARMPNSAPNLAAHGVAFALGVLIQSPVIQLLAAATALSGTARSYRRLRRYILIMCTILTGVHLIIGLTPVYMIIAGRLMGVPAEIARLSRPAFLLMAPTALGVGTRRLWQGVLIRHGRAGIIPATMLTRLGAVVVAAAIGLAFPFVAGASMGAMVMTVGIIVGALVSLAFARPVVRGLVAGDEPLSWRELNRF